MTLTCIKKSESIKYVPDAKLLQVTSRAQHQVDTLIGIARAGRIWLVAPASMKIIGVFRGVTLDSTVSTLESSYVCTRSDNFDAMIKVVRMSENMYKRT